MDTPELPIELDLLQSATCVDIHVTSTRKQPTSADDWHLEIEGRLGEEEDDDVEFAGMGFLYAIGLLSFADARPRGYSENDFLPTDEWQVSDLLRAFRFERGELRFYADYVRGRCMKTEVRVRRDGTFSVSTTNRGEAATRWIARLQGKKLLTAVPPAGTGGRGVIPGLSEKVRSCRGLLRFRACPRG